MADPQLAKLHSSYEYVIIGSGSAGSVIASRIAAAVPDRVLLLEAGPSDQHIYIRMPAALGMPLADDRFNWLYQSEPEPELEHRKIVEARGRVLGGSSSINGMNWVRGNPWDYDNWACAWPERLELCRVPALFPPRGDVCRRGGSVSRRQRPDAGRDLSGRKPALPRVHRGRHPGRPRACRRSQCLPPGGRPRHATQRSRRHPLEHLASLPACLTAAPQSRRGNQRARDGDLVSGQPGRAGQSPAW